MALVTCPDCGRQCSTTASTCPGCGRSMVPAAAYFFGCLAGLAVLLWCGYVLWSCNAASDAATSGAR